MALSIKRDDVSSLIAYLRSGLPLDQPEREIIARRLESRFTYSGGLSGCAADTAMWGLVNEIENFYLEWRSRNWQANVRDRGVCKQMKYLSCVYLIQIDRLVEGPQDHHDPERLFTMLHRPKKRRVFLEDVCERLGAKNRQIKK
jgi:hypothetical protein